MPVKAEQKVFSDKLRSEGATWAQIVAEFHTRWGLNARQTVRLARGMSQQDVANEWCRRWRDDPKTFKNVSTWERWPEAGHMPSLVVLDRLAQIYRCAVADLVSDFTDHGTGHNEDVDRRSFLVGAVGSLATPSLGAPGPAFDVGTANYFAAQLSTHWKTDRDLGPYMLLGTVAAQTRTLLEAVHATHGGLHRRFLELAAAYTGFAGWLAQDGGDLVRCSQWLDETLELAHRSGDAQLIAYALTCKAMLRVDLDDGSGAIDLANAALAIPDLSPKAQVMAMQQAAFGYALTGHRSRVDRLLDDLGILLDDLASDSRPWGGDRLRRAPDHIVNVQRATCYGRLGLSRHAVDLWNKVERDGAHDERRDRGVYLTRHATALLDVGEPREAARRAGEAAQYLRQTGSARMRREFLRLHDKAVPWAATSAGRDLNDVLDSIHH